MATPLINVSIQADLLLSLMAGVDLVEDVEGVEDMEIMGMLDTPLMMNTMIIALNAHITEITLMSTPITMAQEGGEEPRV